MRPTIAVVFDQQPVSRYYRPTLDALDHALEASPFEANVEVLRTTQIDDAFIDRLASGVVVGPGTPYDRPEAAERVITAARERGVPLVGT
jgi:CTP synthase (UTP-ammonia lyase)